MIGRAPSSASSHIAPQSPSDRSNATMSPAPGASDEIIALSRLQQQFSDDLAAFEQRLGAAGFGERQAVVDQRADAAGGEVVQQHGHRRGTDVGPVVEAMDRE